MRKWIVAIAVLALLGVGGFYAMKMLSPPPADLDLARSKETANGRYTVAVEPEAEPLQTGTLHTWLVTVTSNGTPVTDAQISVDGGMPQHGHGLPTAPQATGHIGEGRYQIEGVRFNMGGWWVLKLTVDSPAGRDDVEFNLTL